MDVSSAAEVNWTLDLGMKFLTDLGSIFLLGFSENVWKATQGINRHSWAIFPTKIVAG